MKASDLIVQVLWENGVTHVYEMVGGMITHIIDSIARDGRICLVSMHHEQGAAFAAEGHARMKGTPFVAMATSGPGATNLLTGIGSCYFDSIPAVFITGQVNRHELKGQSAVRQLGFQETDIVAMAKPVTKAIFQILDPKELQSKLQEAFQIAREGRPGPVLVDIPMDVQRVELEWLPLGASEMVNSSLPVNDVTSILAALRGAKRPMLLLGGGIRSGQAKEALDAFLTKVKVPACYSLMGIDSLHSTHPLRVGLIGSYGNRWANHAMGISDCLLVLGSRLDIRQTGADIASFRGNKTIIQVDCDPSETNNRIKGCFAVHMQIKDFLLSTVEAIGRDLIDAPNVWMQEIDSLKELYPDTAELDMYSGINPNRLMHELACRSTRAAAVITDIGQHQMWAAQSFDLAYGQRFLTSGGMGSMGFSLPAAIGACYGANLAPVVVVAGDGGFQCNIQELETIRRNSLPIKMVVIDNGCLGMVRQFQESYFDSRFQSTKDGYSAPRFDLVAQAYEIPGKIAETESTLSEALDWLWSTKGPALLTVRVNDATNVYPKLAYGRPFTEMEPQAKPVDMEST